jgi:hypothetical protein
MRGLKRHRSAPSLAAGHALVQNLHRDHYDITTEVPSRHRPASPSTTSHSLCERAQHPDHCHYRNGGSSANSPASLVTATLTDGTILVARGAAGSSWKSIQARHQIPGSEIGSYLDIHPAP